MLVRKMWKVGLLLMLVGCTDEKKETEKAEEVTSEKVAPSKTVEAPFVLPAGLEWLTNQDDPIFASVEAKRGGGFTQSMVTFPNTFRTVGPDSNSGIRGALLAGFMTLTDLHPNTSKIIPQLATHWAVAKDQQTVYYKISKDPVWSDGVPLTADDFVFTLEMMRSKEIVAPWYNNYYTEKILDVKKHASDVISVKYHVATPTTELLLSTGLPPYPRHFYKLDKNFVKEFNWKAPPSLGAYRLDKFKLGKSITFKRKKEWWGDSHRYLKHRFNPDKVVYNVVRDLNSQWERFLKGRQDTFGLTLPSFWHEKANRSEFKNGYINRLWFYNDMERSPYFIALNVESRLWKSKSIRYAFAHSLNLDKVFTTVLRGDYERLQNFSTGHGVYDLTTIKARTFDPQKVETLVKAEGFKRGKDGIWVKGDQRFSVQLTHGMAWHNDRLVILKEEAKKAGVELRLNQLDSSAAFKSFLEKKHQTAYMGLTTNFTPSYWQSFHSENAKKPQTNNFCNISDSELDKAIDAYRNATDEKVRIASSHRVQTLVHESGCIVPLYLVPYFREGYWRYWKLPKVSATKRSQTAFSAFDTSSGGLFWLDQEEKKRVEAAMKAKKKLEPIITIDKTYKQKG